MYLTILELSSLELNSFCSISVSDVMIITTRYGIFGSLFSVLLLQEDEKA